jgi:hypothetical protein
MNRLSGERNGSSSTERLPEAGKHRQVGVERHSLQATDAERGEAVVVLQVSERPLDSGTPSVCCRGLYGSGDKNP